ncbi:MAG: peptidase [Saprospirales bacterium]|nr:peptidase [Saprospirales bacterium]
MRIVLLLSILLAFSCTVSKETVVSTAARPAAKPKPGLTEKVKGMQHFPGYFDFYWDEKKGKVWLLIDKLDMEFLYVNSLAAGVGSNDIGLDRGQLGQERIMEFRRSGDKVLFVQKNYDYRAESDNELERQAVQEAFAESVLWGFKVEAEEDGKLLVDATPYLLQDAHQVAKRLKDRKQGSYKLDQSRSAIYLPRTKNFPENTEFEATLTFVGDAQGAWIRSVAPTPEAVTVRQHHSFVKLPDPGYESRPFDPRCGFFGMSYYDYATPIDQPIRKRFITRHRLEKKDPAAAVSEPVEPIVYYLDPGVPEPVRSALLEGASWWNQAFEAAGYRNAFRVEMLPADADPMDVRYNLIQWVHRSTRGWSYGGSVIDPRTGEIIKGKVTLGSLRVRQDFLIAQGLLAAYENGDNPDPRLMEMALARLRQLSAHEVGHTLGLAHNFTASVDNRASVMDYPHPYITLNDDGSLDFSKAYDTGIGEWDKRTILYGYQDFPEGTDEKAALNAILEENMKMGLHYLSDQDARPQSSAHPLAHLWDNGSWPTDELKRLMEVRNTALKNFGLDNIPNGTPLAKLERVLVPLYLAHRYQVEAVAKVIGGVNYTYTVKGFETRAGDQWKVRPVSDEKQAEALQALLSTLDTRYLELPENIRELIPPQPIGYRRDRETFKGNTGLVFDPMAGAESAAATTIALLLNPERLTRLVQQKAAEPDRLVSPQYVIEMLLTRAFFNHRETPWQAEMANKIEKLAVRQLIALAADKNADQQVAAIALLQLDDLDKQLDLELANEKDFSRKAHLTWLKNEIRLFRQNPKEYQLPPAPQMPDGSPIGCGEG